MTMARLPLANHPFVHSRSLDEAQAIQTTLFGPSKLERTERGTPFEWRANIVTLGPLVFSAASYDYGARSWAPGSENIFALAIPLATAAGEINHGGLRVPMDTGRTGLVASPGPFTEVQAAPGFQSVVTVIPRVDMELALSSLVGPGRRMPLQFEPRLSTDSGPGAALLRLVHFIIGEIEADSTLLTSPLIAARWTDLLIYSLLSSQPHNHEALLRPTPRAAAPACVRRAEAYIEANAATAIRLGELAAISGASVRTLQAGFRAHRGCTPMQFLRERRLELTRTRLLHAPPGTTVAEVALACGFEHLGRFSLLYRKRFGESPTDTLRRHHG